MLSVGRLIDITTWRRIDLSVKLEVEILTRSVFPRLHRDRLVNGLDRSLDSTAAYHSHSLTCHY